MSLSHVFNFNSNELADKHLADLCLLSTFRCKRDSDCGSSGRRKCCRIERRIPIAGRIANNPDDVVSKPAPVIDDDDDLVKPALDNNEVAEEAPAESLEVLEDDAKDEMFAENDLVSGQRRRCNICMFV